MLALQMLVVYICECNLNQAHSHCGFLHNLRDMLRSVCNSSHLQRKPECLLQGYKPPDAAPSEYQTIPLNKIEDFGVHSDRYYPLDISYFKSSLDSYMLDLLWNKYWVNTLSSSPLLGTQDLRTGQIADIGEPIQMHCQSSCLSSRFLWSQKWVCAFIVQHVLLLSARACGYFVHLCQQSGQF